jgi:hypothetical protein
MWVFSAPAELLSKVCGVVRASFMDVDPDEYRFTLVALAATPPVMEDEDEDQKENQEGGGSVESEAVEVQQAETTV